MVLYVRHWISCTQEKNNKITRSRMELFWSLSLHKCNQQMFDKYFWQQYNILNKRAVGQCTPDRRIE